MQEDKVLAPRDVEPLLLSFQDRGLDARFRCRPNGLIECLSCGHENPADNMPLLALYQVEGDNPDARQVITVLRCQDCREEGFLVFAQFPLSSRDEAMCLAELCSEQ